MSDNPAAPGAGDTRAADPTGADPRGVFVIRPGAEPRAVRQYTVSAGTKRTAAHALIQTVDGVEDSREVNEWTLAVTTTAQAMVFDVKVTSGPRAGMTDTWSIDDRGLLARVASDGPGGVMREAFAAPLLPLLPREAIGPGARWNAPAAIFLDASHPAHASSIAWELISTDAGGITVRGTVSSQPQRIEGSDPPLEVSVTGRIDSAFDLATLVGWGAMRLEVRIAPPGATPPPQLVYGVLLEHR